MAKISLVSRRRRDTRLPETEAQRRARERESSKADEPQTLQLDELGILSGVLSLELPEFAVDDLTETTSPIEIHDTDDAPDFPADVSPETSGMMLQLALSPEQSQIVSALPYLANAHEQNMDTPTFELTEYHNQSGVVLQFSLHTETVPQMISMKDICHQLKIGRRSVLRLIHQGRLRSYRVGRQYRFAASDVKQYLKQISSQ